jgi:hypothetical protein
MQCEKKQTTLDYFNKQVVFNLDFGNCLYMSVVLGGKWSFVPISPIHPISQ